MSLFPTRRLKLRSGKTRLRLRMGPISLEGLQNKKSMLPVYGFLTHDFMKHENPWTPVASEKTCFLESQQMLGRLAHAFVEA